MHTLNTARSVGQDREEIPSHVHRGEEASRPTLIIAPKSSIESCDSIVYTVLTYANVVF